MSNELFDKQRRLKVVKNDTSVALQGKTVLETDEQLIQKISQKDKEAYTRLYKKYQPRLFSYCNKMLQGDEALAADIVDEGLFEVWLSASRFAGRSSVSTWIYSITRNRLISFLRKTTEILPGDDKLNFEQIDETSSQIHNYATTKRRDYLMQALTKLSLEHREILLMVYVKELSVKEIAIMLELPENTVKTRMFYARKRLKRVLGQAGLNSYEDSI